MLSTESGKPANSRPKRVLVTGASGFVGRSVSIEFESHGHLVTGTSTSGEDDLHALDLERPDQITQVLEEIRPEVIIHLAGIQSARVASQDPDRAFRINTGGTASMLREAERLVPGAHFLLGSTAAVYGGVRSPAAGLPGGDQLPFRESDPVRPESPYGASKAAAEVLALEVTARTEMPVTVVRLFNQIGATQPSSQVPAGFAAAIALAEASGEDRLTLDVGDPDRVRDFTDTRDTASALRLISERRVTGRLNLCRGETHSLARVIEVLSGLTEVEVKVRRMPEKTNPNDVPTISGSPARLERATGWSSEVSLEESLSGLLEIQREAARRA